MSAETKRPLLSCTEREYQAGGYRERLNVEYPKFTWPFNLPRAIGKSAEEVFAPTLTMSEWASKWGKK